MLAFLHMKNEIHHKKKIVIIWERLTKNHLFYGAVGECIHHIDVGTVAQNSHPLYFPECQSNKLWNGTGAPRIFGPTEIWRTMLHLLNIPKCELYVHGVMKRKRRTGEWVSYKNTQRIVISHYQMISRPTVSSPSRTDSGFLSTRKTMQDWLSQLIMTLSLKSGQGKLLVDG